LQPQSFASPFNNNISEPARDIVEEKILNEQFNQPFATNPAGLFSKKNRSLIATLVKREIEQRYRGSVFGLLWVFLTPIFMLSVFTLVFGVVFQSRWGNSTGNTLEFALVLFAGLTTFNVFSEVVSAAPQIITSQPNLVKKIVFPLEILPLISLGVALFQATIAYFILFLLQVSVGSGSHIESLALPVLLVPICLFALGLSWFLAAFGVYVRDTAQAIQPVMTGLMFVSAVFFPLSAMPEWLRPAMVFNPIISAVEMSRNAMIFGTLPDASTLLFGTAAGLMAALTGLAFFRRVSHGFADVL
jgi:lipopolysaccharide transport system permease protein